jgi:hypothetical protein
MVKGRAFALIGVISASLAISGVPLAVSAETSGFNTGAILENHGNLVVVSGQVLCGFPAMSVYVSLTQNESGQRTSGKGQWSGRCTVGSYVPFWVMISPPKGSVFDAGSASADGIAKKAHAGHRFQGSIRFSAQIELIAPIIDPPPPPRGPTV